MRAWRDGLPGPRGHPVIGSLVPFRRDLLGFLARCAAEHGDFVPVRVATRRGFLASDPEAIADVLLRRNADFRKVFMLRNNKMFLGNGLLTSEGEQWRRERRLAQPAFHGDRIREYAGVVVDEATRMADVWRTGGVRDVQQDMMELTLRTVLRCLFAVDEDLDLDRIEASVEVIQQRLKERLAALVPLPDTAWTPRNVRLRRAVHDLDEVVRGFAERRSSGRDLLSQLRMARDEDGTTLTGRQLRDQAMTMFFAGHETTALALSWSWMLLSQHPEVRDAVHTEVHEVLGDRPPGADDVARLVTVRQVVQEAMRLYPPVYAFGRDAVRDTVVGGHPVRKGMSVIIAPWVLHRDPRFFPDPAEFRPQRWTREFERRLPKFAYCPFGGGARLCIGRSFAMTEAVLVLAELARHHDPQLVAPRPIELWPTFTLRSRHGLPMTVHAARKGLVS